MISKLYHSFLRYTSNTSIFSASVLIVLTMLVSRPEAFGFGHSIAKLRNLIVLACATQMAIDAIFIRKLQAAWFAAVFLLLLMIQSWVSIFTPAVYPGTPMQDFMLARDVSAYFQWNYAIRLIGNLGLMFLMICILPALYQELGDLRRRIFSQWIYVILAANVLLALFQGFYSIEMFSDGSGSAVSAGRAPAFLEDSGASTVMFSAALSFFIGKSVTKPTALVVVGTFILAIAGYQTGGRTFFVSSFAGGLFALAIYAKNYVSSANRVDSKRALAIGMTMAPLIVALLYKIPQPVISVATGLFTEMVSGTNLLESVANHLWSVDPVRSTSLRVMIVAAKSRFWTGAGFGTYHSYYREYFPEVERTWGQGYDYLDLPASLYSAIPAELGVLNGCLIFTFLAVWIIIRRKILFCTPMIPVAAGVFSIVCSFWFGLHFLFQSFAIAFGMLIAAVEYSSSKSRIQWSLKAIASIILVSLIVSILIKIQFAPRQVSFRSEVLSGPQLPVGINAPISSRGRKGLWLASGAEVFYPGEPLKIFIEQPADNYPVKINWIVRGTDSRKLDEGNVTLEKLDKDKGGIDIRIGNINGASCPSQFRKNLYCSIQITTTPEWKWGRDRLGWFLITDEKSKKI